MTTAELKEYLAMVVQTEKEVNLQDQLCQQINQKLNECDQSIMLLSNSIRPVEFPATPVRKNNNAARAKKDMAQGPKVLVGTLICLLGTLFSLAIGMPFLALIFDIPLIVGIFATIPYLFSSLLSLLFYSSEVQKDEDNYNKELEKYQNQCRRLEELKKENEKKRSKIEELKAQKQAAEAYRQQVEKALASSHRNLDKMYSYNVVFPKYRNYVMVSSLYEYLCAGRCTTLEGHEGAYNILELEIRLDRIITQLDRVLQNLAAIQANQYTLYSCLQDSNRKIDMLLQEESRMADSILHLGTQASAVNARLESLQESSELTSYLTECNQRELHYMNRMNYLAGHYDNPYGNYSPV